MQYHAAMQRLRVALYPLVIVSILGGCGGGESEPAAAAAVLEPVSNTSSSTPRPKLGCGPVGAEAFCPERVVVVGSTVLVGLARSESPATFQWTLTRPA